MTRIYFDACIPIYLIERHAPFSTVVSERLRDSKDSSLVTSELTRMECLIKPIRTGDFNLVLDFNEWIDDTNVVLIDKQVFDRATVLRADFSSLKTPDALHLAAAQVHNCDEFWTNDDRLSKVAPDLVINIFDTDTNA